LWNGFLFYEKPLDRIDLIFLISHFPEENAEQPVILSSKEAKRINLNY